MRIHRFVTVLVVALFSTLAFAQSNPMQRGVELFRQGEYAAALQQFREASRAQPTNALIENLIGITETKLGRISEADADYERAIRLNPNLPEPHKNLAFNYMNAKQYGPAEAQLRTAEALAGNDSFVHYYLAILYLYTEKDKLALSELKAAEPLIENDPDNAFLMAKACLRAGDSAEALKIIEAVEQSSGFSVDQEYELGRSLNVQRMYPESVQRFQRIVSMQPTSWVSKYNLAIALFQANQQIQALPLLESLATERPHDANILSLLGYCYESAGKLPLALAAYERAVKADPQNPDRYLDYTRLLMDLDRYDEANELVQQGIQNAKDSYSLDIRAGAIEMMKGDLEKAQQDFQKGVAEHPEVALGYIALAETYMKQGDNQTAAKVLTGARDRLPRDFALEYVFGLVSARLGETEQAIQALKNAEVLGPNVVEPHYQLGKLYQESGQLADARSEFERVLALNPDHAPAHYQLSRIYARMGEAKKSQEMATDTSQLIQTQRDAAIKAQKARLGEFPPD